MDECGGLLVTHDDGCVECLEACGGPDALLHPFRAPCHELPSGCAACGGTAGGLARRRRAA